MFGVAAPWRWSAIQDRAPITRAARKRNDMGSTRKRAGKGRTNAVAEPSREPVKAV
jgi:hypothetical protein